MNSIQNCESLTATIERDWTTCGVSVGAVTANAGSRSAIEANVAGHRHSVINVLHRVLNL